MTHATHTAAQADRIRDRLEGYLAAAQGPRDDRERQARLAKLQALEARSDAELAMLGLTRPGIPAFVFRDLFDL